MSGELGEKSGADLTSFSLAYSKSFRTLSPVKTPAWGWKCEKERACARRDFTHWNDI